MMENSMDKYLGQLLDNRYELIEVIGTGGMAIVFKALCHRLNRYVALKMLRDDLALDADFLRRFQTESQAVAKLSHPNIVSVYDVSRSSDHEYIVMELIEGITLKQYINKRNEPLGEREVVHFAIQIAKALSHAHSRGIIHRDIKPHNIMLVKDGTLKVADFGIARLMDTQPTMTQEALGSVHYISPEQAKGGEIDARSDIYSTGIVMYEMLTGSLPFEGDSAVSIAIQHISSVAEQPRELNPDISEWLESITMKAMSPNLDERYESADTLLADLEEYRKSMDLNLTAREEAKIRSRGEGRYQIYENVKPLGATGEMSREKYKRRKSRSRKVSLLSGIFCVTIFVLAIFVFLWNYWLKDLFSEPERITIPRFIGSYEDEIIGNQELSGVFRFTVKRVYKPDIPQGEIFDQSPEEGKSVLKSDTGVEVTLYVSTGDVTLTMPDVLNQAYRQATKDLEERGFIVELEIVPSDTITRDYVVATIPEAGQDIRAGDTIILRISGGPEIVMVLVPNLIGMTQAQAIAKLEEKKLSQGAITTVESNQPIGTVVWQSPEPDTEVEERSKINFQVSGGPAQTTPPSSQPPTDDGGTGGDVEPPPVVDDGPGDGE